MPVKDIYPCSDVCGLWPLRLRFRVLYDVPLPCLLVLHDFNTLCCNTDIICRLVPTAIRLSRQVLVTFDFVQWVARRARERRYPRRLLRDIFLYYLEHFEARVRAVGASALLLRQVVQFRQGPDILERVERNAHACFTNALFLAHRDKFILLDGAGERLDAEFKMAPKVVRKGQHPFHATFVARGARGF